MYLILKCRPFSKYVGLIVCCMTFQYWKAAAQYCVSMQCLILKVSNSRSIYVPIHHPNSFFQSLLEISGAVIFLLNNSMCSSGVSCVRDHLFHVFIGKTHAQTFEYGSICTSLDYSIHSCPHIKLQALFLNQLVGLRDKLQEHPIFHGKIYGFL